MRPEPLKEPGPPGLFAPVQGPDEHHIKRKRQGNHHNRVFLAQKTEKQEERRGNEVSHPLLPSRFRTLHMKKNRRQRKHHRQEVRPADDIGHGLRLQRMRREKKRGENCNQPVTRRCRGGGFNLSRRRRNACVTRKFEDKKVNQHAARDVQEKIDNVIARRFAFAAQNDVVHIIRKNRQRPVKIARIAPACPVVGGPDFRGEIGIRYIIIPADYEVVIISEFGLEGVQI